jgi:hypothetical protein
MQKKNAECSKFSNYHTDLGFQLRLLSEEQERSEAEIWSCEKQRGGLLANNSFYRSRKTKKIVILCCDKTFEDGNRKRRGGWSVSLVGEVQLGYLQEAAGSLQLENN